MTTAVGGDIAALIVLGLALCTAATVVAAIWWLPMAIATVSLGIINVHLHRDFGIETGYFLLSPLDLIALIAVAAAGIRLVTAGRITGLQLICLAVTTSLALAFFYGSARFGVATAGTFYRQFFYLTAVMLYAMTFPWDGPDVDRFVRLWLIAGALLAILCLSLWMAPGWIEFEAGDWGPFAYLSRRVLPAASALLLSQVALIGIAAWVRGQIRPVLLLLTILCLLLTLLLFHRSVWVSTLAGLAALMLVNPRSLVPVSGILLVVGLIGGAAAGLAGGFGQDMLAAPVASAVGEALSENSSLDWRVTGWDILLQRTFAQGPLSILFGDGFGVGYERQIGWSQVGYSPHNVYVEIFINAGLVGLGLWLLFHAATMLLLWTRQVPDDTLLDRGASVALMASLLTYGLPYSPPTEQGFLIGVIGVIAMRSLRTAAPANTEFREAGR